MSTEIFGLEFPGKGVIHGEVRGAGDRLLLCLHGYGADHRQFDRLLSPIPSGWRVLSLDLPFFGASEWEPDEGLSKEFLEALADRVAEKAGAPICGLMGFSIGARLGMSLFSVAGKEIDKVILIAPDGLRMHPLYRFCVYNPVGRALFRFFMWWPGPLLLSLRIAFFFRMIDAFRFRFFHSQLAQKEKRLRLRNVWFCYASLRPSMGEIERKTLEERAKWHIIWGRKDRVLSPEAAKRSIDGLSMTELHLVEGGHDLLRKPSEELKSLVRNILE